MKKNLFICDNCESKTIDVGIGSGYPYDEGWRYLHRIEFKFNDFGVSSNEYRDKHFCSTKCMCEFVTKVINADERGVRNEQTCRD